MFVLKILNTKVLYMNKINNYVWIQVIEVENNQLISTIGFLDN